MTWSARAGRDQLAVVSSSTVPSRPANGLLEEPVACGRPPRPARTRCRPRAAVSVGVPRRRLQIGRRSSSRAGDSQLDGPLDGRLAGLVRAQRTTVTPGRQVDVELAIARRSRTWSRRILTAHLVAPRAAVAERSASPQLGRRVRRSRTRPSPPPRARRSCLEVADEARDRVRGGGLAPSVVAPASRRRRTRTLRTRRRQPASRSPSGSTGRARPGGRRRSHGTVEDEVRGSPFRPMALDEAAWVGTHWRRRRSRFYVPGLRRPGCCRDRHRSSDPRCRCFVELDEEHLARAILVDGPRPPGHFHPRSVGLDCRSAFVRPLY
jgi:hypothetical protein